MSDAKGPAAPAWPFPETLDALVAAPLHHTLLFENERVRVLETRIAPGDTTPLHTHRWPSVLYVIGQSDMVRRDERGAVEVDTRTSATPASPPGVRWLPPLNPHTLENVGTAEIHVITVELKG